MTELTNNFDYLQSFIDEQIWDEARIFIGLSAFNDGIKSPIFKGILISESNIKNDALKIYAKD